MRERHRKRVVPRRRTAHTHADAASDTDEEGAHHRGDERIVRNSRPNGRKLLEDGVKKRIAPRSDGGINDKFAPQHLCPEEIAEKVEKEGGDGGGEIEEA